MDSTQKSRSQDLLDAASCRVGVAKIRELRQNAATALALGALLGEEAEARQEAYAGLIRRCKKALRLWPGGRLFVPASGFPPELPQDVDIYVVEEVGKLIAEYRPFSRRSVLLAALDGEFRHFPRRVSLRFIDMLRKHGPKRSEDLSDMLNAAKF